MAVSASGALSPGPLTVVTINNSFRYGRRFGFMVSAGHMAFELPLVIALSLGIIAFIEDQVVRMGVGLAGALTLIVFGFLELRSSLNNSGEGFRESNSRLSKMAGGSAMLRGFLVGLLFTGLNPYFIIWWMTIGLHLVVRALTLASLLGVLIMYVFHVWLDYAWLGFLSYAAASGKNLIKPKHLRLISMGLSLLLIGLGILLLISVL